MDIIEDIDNNEIPLFINKIKEWENKYPISHVFVYIIKNTIIT